MPVTEKRLADTIRVLAMDAVQAANSGHPGMPMGMADVATVLFKDYLKYDPADPQWPDRDRFVLSAGHGSMLIYALLHLTGYAEPTMQDIAKFRQVDSPCAGHPENFLLPGVEATTGPLGQGVAMAVGMAMAERHLNATFGDDLVDHRTWVIAGDGCLMEGVNHEAIGLAGHLGLGRLNVLWDDNKITIDGAVSMSSSEDVLARYAATGWHVTACDGHDVANVRRAIDEAIADPRPSLIACRTNIGHGSPNMAGSHKVHGAPLGAAEIAETRAALGWDLPAFELPEDVKAAWLEIGQGGNDAYNQWQDRFAKASDKAEFERRMKGELPADYSLKTYLDGLIADPKKVATRKASEMTLDAINPQLPDMFGGSADLTGSNLTQSKDQKVGFTRDDYSGRYAYYGIREFGMSAAMNGMALHGGVIPYGGTFLIFSDYARNAIRMSALQQVRVVYVLTHDSIGLGEDGPTHQPIEQLATLRLIPNFTVVRPADANETSAAWLEIVRRTSGGPVGIALTRQNIPVFPRGEQGFATVDGVAKGAYVLIDAAGGTPDVILVATGSEVQLAVAARETLAAEGIDARVVSAPSLEWFAEQDADYRESVLPSSVTARVSVEAGATPLWHSIVGDRGRSVGIDHFGASADYKTLFEKFGVTAEAVVEAARATVKENA